MSTTIREWYNDLRQKYGAVGLALLIATPLVVLLLVGLSIAAYRAISASRVTPTPTPIPTPTVQPLVQLSPPVGEAGTSVTVTGTGWQPGDTVFVYLGQPPTDSEALSIASAKVTEDGSFTTKFTIPPDVPEDDASRVLVTIWSPATGAEFLTVLQIQVSTPTPTPTSTPTPTATPSPTPTTTPTSTPITFSGWRGEYYDNRLLSGTPTLVRDDANVNFNWSTGAPAKGLPADNFSVRWVRALPFQRGTYRFYVRSDDGVRVWLDGDLIIDRWSDVTTEAYIVERTLTAGTHTLRVEYYEGSGVAYVHFGWEWAGDFPQWRGEYFSNVALVGAPAVIRNDKEINFDWGRGAPASGVRVDGFSARWTRVLRFEGGLYRFYALVDDGVRVYVDDTLVIDTWQDGTVRQVTEDHTLSTGDHSLRVEYYERVGDARIRVWWEKLTSYPDWRGEYWSNRNLSGDSALVRNDRTVDFNWSQGAPAAGVPADNFSVRWTRALEFDRDTYRFHLVMDDGARLWIDDQLVLDAWEDGAAREVTADHALAQGEHDVRVEYYERTGEALIRLWWEKVVSPTYPDWKGEYWSNRDLSGSPSLIRNDEAVDFRWGTGAPAVGLPGDDFSVRWSRETDFDAGVYRFYAWADDGIRVYVDNEVVIDEWHESAGDEVYIKDLELSGRRKVVVEYYERGGEALVRFWWKRMGDLVTPTPTATSTSTSTPTPTPTPTPTNESPVAVDDSATTEEGIAVMINILDNDYDPDGDPLVLKSYPSTSAQGGTVHCTANGVCAYTPPAGFTGNDTFKYTVRDDKDATATATVTVTVNPEATIS